MKKWHKIVVGISIVLVVAFIFAFFLGYRPIKSTGAFVDWQGTTTIVQIFSVLALVVAVFYQVFNNKAIAKGQEALLQKQIDHDEQFASRQHTLLNTQNDIILFDKRYESLQALIFVMNLLYSSYINSSDDESYKEYVFKHIGNDKMGRSTKAEIFINKIQLIRNSRFLFGKIKDEINNFLDTIDGTIFGMEMYRFDDRFEYDFDNYSEKEEFLVLEKSIKANTINSMTSALDLANNGVGINDLKF